MGPARPPWRGGDALPRVRRGVGCAPARPAWHVGKPFQPFYAYSRLFVRLFTFCGRATPDARERIPTTPHQRERVPLPRRTSGNARRAPLVQKASPTANVSLPLA
jgi:hypothetical protein